MNNQKQKYISEKGKSEHLSKRRGILSERMDFLCERGGRGEGKKGIGERKIGKMESWRNGKLENWNWGNNERFWIGGRRWMKICNSGRDFKSHPEFRFPCVNISLQIHIFKHSFGFFELIKVGLYPK